MLGAGGAVLSAGILIPGSGGLLVSSLLALAALATALLYRMTEKEGQPYPLLPLLSYGALLVYYASQSGSALGLSLPDAMPFYVGAEALAVAAGAAAPLLYRPPWQPRLAAVAAMIAGGFFALAWARPWILATMVMWNTGFSLWLPYSLYAVALGLYVYTVLALLGQGHEARRAAYGLLLLALGGLKLDYSPYALMALIGYVNLAWPPALERAPRKVIRSQHDRQSLAVTLAN